jgi:Nup53/35/40-type RNA recognition motif
VTTVADGHQIIVYGYDEKSKEYVLQKFHKIGLVEDIKENGGNSISIKYRDINSAYKAADFHGHVLAENTMIGVKLIKQQEKKNYELQYQYTIPASYLKKKNRKKDTLWNKILIYIFNLDYKY